MAALRVAGLLRGAASGLPARRVVVLVGPAPPAPARPARAAGGGFGRPAAGATSRCRSSRPASHDPWAVRAPSARRARPSSMSSVTTRVSSGLGVVRARSCEEDVGGAGARVAHLDPGGDPAADRSREPGIPSSTIVTAVAGRDERAQAPDQGGGRERCASAGAPPRARPGRGGGSSRRRRDGRFPRGDRARSGAWADGTRPPAPAAARAGYATAMLLLVDLDGVVYRGAAPIPGVAAVLADRAARGDTVVYVTNNSMHYRADYVTRLDRPGRARDGRPRREQRPGDRPLPGGPDDGPAGPPRARGRRRAASSASAATRASTSSRPPTPRPARRRRGSTAGRPPGSPTPSSSASTPSSPTRSWPSPWTACITAHGSWPRTVIPSTRRSAGRVPGPAPSSRPSRPGPR